MGNKEKNETRKVRLVHVIIQDGEGRDIINLGNILNRMQDKMEEKNGIREYEFLITNQRIELRSMDLLIDELKRFSEKRDG